MQQTRKRPGRINPERGLRVTTKSANIVAGGKGGKQKGIGTLIGQAKKQNPNANRASIGDICLKLIAEIP